MSAAASNRQALVLLAGPLSDPAIVRGDWAFIVAADGGAAHALDQGVFPNLVVGDFDSLSGHHLNMLRTSGVPIHELPTAKDFTDGELAVRKAIEQSPTTIVIAGGLGGRFDHALGNVMLLSTIRNAGIHGYATDGLQRVYFLQHALDLTGQPGDQLSIIPLSGCIEGLTLTGVRWPLSQAEIPFASTRTLSNELTQTHVSITAPTGQALVVVTPYSPSS